MTIENKTYRRVNMALGGWRWGYPRGHRYGVVEYVVGYLRDGTRVWKSSGFVCSGLTARNIDHYSDMYPVAFSHALGSIHNQQI